MRHQVRSVLCVPLHYLGDLSGVLYLENNLAVGAFTEERIEILKLLSGQIGVSIANAELYEQLEEEVRLRTSSRPALFGTLAAVVLVGVLMGRRR